MKNRRNHRVVKKSKFSLPSSLGTAFIQHVKKNVTSYAPALAPIGFFFLAHLVTLLLFICMKIGVLPKDQLLHKAVVTWAVYGLLPFLLSSYLCFYFVARPSVKMLERKLPDWPPDKLDWASGAVYGVALGILLEVLLKPTAFGSGMMLLLIGIAAGQGNWFFYRKVTADAH